MPAKKEAVAYQRAMDRYTINYPDDGDSDVDVPWHYIEGLLAGGYTVHVEHGACRVKGEPSRETFLPT